MKVHAVVVVLVVSLTAGIAFFAGTKYQASLKTAVLSRQGMNGRAPGQFGARNGGNAVSGEILSVDDKSVSVKLPDGSSKIVLLPTSVTISKATEGSKSDLKVGERVMILGTTNTDGSVTAINISLNPQMRLGASQTTEK